VKSESRARLIEHPDDMIEGRRYRVAFKNAHGRHRCVRVVFCEMGCVALDLYLRFVETAIPWRAVVEIRELDQA
jgi:hypothetical protein